MRSDTIGSSGGIERSHPYPCRFPPETPKPFLADGGVILDPFCGSGTTLVEAASGYLAERVIGWDCNPIAILISKYMCLPNDSGFIAQCYELLQALSAPELLNRANGLDLPEFPGREHWFDPQVRAELAACLKWIEDTSSSEHHSIWLRCALSSIVTRVSYQDSDTRYKRIPRNVREGEVVSAFESKASELLSRLESRVPLAPQPEIILHDVMGGFPLPEESVDSIVTSPPYANTMDYYLYHKQRMNVLGLDFKVAQAAEIGSRYEYSSRKRPKEKWEEDMSVIISEMGRVLKRGGQATLIMGDSQIAGVRVDASKMLTGLSVDLGLEAEVLESVPMDQRTRAFNASFQRPGKFEHIIRLSKA